MEDIAGAKARDIDPRPFDLYDEFRIRLDPRASVSTRDGCANWKGRTAQTPFAR